MNPTRRRATGALLLVLIVASCGGREGQERWYRGNTHTHTLWSDGNAAPELVAGWYVEHGYDFLVLSDHNILSPGERWFPVSDEEGERLTSIQVGEIEAAFGAEWVTVRDGPDGREMRLKTLDELRGRFEIPGEFLFIQGEEITDSFDEIPVHVNGLYLAELIPPQHGASLGETIQRNIDAVIEQGRRLGRPTLAHLNHPNYQWSLTPEDVAAIEGESFFEVYNGHSGVRNHGDADHPGTERMWDLALSLRLTQLELGLLYGLATDDAHQYYRWGLGNTNPGRGWVMVRAAELTPESIVRALKAGEFYASSGVTLSDVRSNDRELIVSIEEEEGLTYTTQFVGTRLDRPAGEETDDTMILQLNEVGGILFETTRNPAAYRFEGDELYVRARVISSRLHPNPYAEGDHEMAWVQPVVPGGNGG